MVKRTIIMIALVLVLCQIGYTQTVDVDKWIHINKNNGEGEVVKISEIDSVTFIECKDIDGNSYEIVKIGTQIWMAENLRVTHYNDHTSSPQQITDCWVYGDVDTYGRLYSWHAVNTGKLAPEGWHVPTKEELEELKTYLTENGHSSTEGTALKSTSDWISDGNGTDNFGFNGLPVGYRTNYGVFSSFGGQASFWSTEENSNDSDEAWALNLFYFKTTLNINEYTKKQGWSVRCVKNSGI